MTGKRTGNGSWQGLLMALAALGMVTLSGCGPRRSVYIPPEWSAPPPAKTAPAPAPSTLKPSPPTPGPSQGGAPILKPPPAIKERDVSPADNKASSASDVAKRVEAPPPPPQHLASMHLVDQARAALAQRKPDDAIPLLEQAIEVDVYNGAAFLELARAWRMKGNNQKALGFARKAEILFQDNSPRLKEVFLFEAELFKDMGDRASQEQARSKASRL